MLYSRCATVSKHLHHNFVQDCEFFQEKGKCAKNLSYSSLVNANPIHEQNGDNRQCAQELAVRRYDVINY